jgi:hypothetical protein
MALRRPRSDEPAQSAARRVGFRPALAREAVKVVIMYGPLYEYTP